MIIDKIILEILNNNLYCEQDTLLIIKDEIIQALVDLPVDTLIDDLYGM